MSPLPSGRPTIAEPRASSVQSLDSGCGTKTLKRAGGARGNPTMFEPIARHARGNPGQRLARLGPAMVEFSPARLAIANEIPKGPGWLYEPKFDGYRCLLGNNAAGHPVVVGRNAKDLGRFFPE